MRKPLLFLLTAACLLFVSYPSLAADSTKVDISGGYAHLDDITLAQNLNGWAASVGGSFNDWFGVVGEIGGGYGTATVSTLECGTCIPGLVLGKSRSLMEYGFMGGPKFVSHHNSKVTPFVQMLVGDARLTAFSASENHFAVQPGGGVDVNMTPNLGLRLQGDYRMFRGPSPQSFNNNFRFVTAIVLRF
jgi:opacity protein-like surface antigen